MQNNNLIIENSICNKNGIIYSNYEYLNMLIGYLK